jgi:hypothetical protein
MFKIYLTIAIVIIVNLNEKNIKIFRNLIVAIIIIVNLNKKVFKYL